LQSGKLEPGNIALLNALEFDWVSKAELNKKRRAEGKPKANNVVKKQKTTTKAQKKSRAHMELDAIFDRVCRLLDNSRDKRNAIYEFRRYAEQMEKRLIERLTIPKRDKLAGFLHECYDKNSLLRGQKPPVAKPKEGAAASEQQPPQRPRTRLHSGFPQFDCQDPAQETKTTEDAQAKTMEDAKDKQHEDAQDQKQEDAQDQNQEDAVLQAPDEAGKQQTQAGENPPLEITFGNPAVEAAVYHPPQEEGGEQESAQQVAV
jgi:hypothetical protein